LLCLSFVLLASPWAAGQDGALQAPPAAPDPALGRELRRSVQAWKDAYNANDASALAAFYAEDAEYISPHVQGLLLRGREAIRANFARGMAAGGHIDTITVLRTGSSGSLAYMVCRYDATNSGVQVNGRNLIIMRKTRGAWLITEHASIVRD
jgi:uncharacterized protein (TIGR02246 family)